MFLFRGFFGKTSLSDNERDNNMNFRAKLEQKLTLGKQDPEPVFDLSDCGLKELPDGFFSWCKVCRKETLLLFNNKLETLSHGGSLQNLTLIRVLDLHNNRLTKLTEKIGILKNLEVLNLEENRLRSLPAALGLLQKLRVLNVKSNKLHNLPANICYLERLQTLDLTHNQITKLPCLLYKIKSLTQLSLDERIMQFPPSEICSKGLIEIMQYLSNECGDIYNPPSPSVPDALDSPYDPSEERRRSSIDASILYQDRWKDIWKAKEQKRVEHLAIEKQLQEDQYNQTMLALEVRNARVELINKMAKEERRMQDELNHAQQIKDRQRQLLLEEVLNVEKEACRAIEQLLASHQKVSSAQLQKEREEFEKMFIKQQKVTESLRRNEVLEAMQQTLAVELREHQWLKEQEAAKMKLVALAASQDHLLDATLNEIVERKGHEQQNLVSELLETEKFQREAFASLMRNRDTENQRICDEILQVEKELARLTHLELRKNDLKLSFGMDLIAEQRSLLLSLLVQLLEDRKAREQELRNWLMEMEEIRERQEVDFWLVNYQTLMDSKPQILKKQELNIDPDVRKILYMANSHNYISVLAKHGVTVEMLTWMDAATLHGLGVKDPITCEAILLATQRFIKRKDDDETLPKVAVTPTESEMAAVATPVEESIPQEMECVVCMDERCEIVFLPCGHICCCSECAKPLDLCPMCRTHLDQAIRVWAQ